MLVLTRQEEMPAHKETEIKAKQKSVKILQLE